MREKTRNPKTLIQRIVSGVLAAVIVVFVSAISAPQLLAFPHKAKIGATTVYAENPIDAQDMAKVLHRSDDFWRRQASTAPQLGRACF